MGDIDINSAPVEFRKYLKLGDRVNGPKANNGKVDTAEEASEANAKYNEENPLNSEKFVAYLEGSGYIHLRYSQIFTDVSEAEIEIERLLRSLEDKNGNNRSEAALQLDTLAHSRIPLTLILKIAGPLIEASEDKDKSVRFWALRSMGALAEHDIPQDLRSKIVKALIKALGDEDYNVRHYAFESMHDISKERLPIELMEKMVHPLIRALADKDWQNRSNSISTLTNIGLADISPELRSNIVDALIRATLEEENDFLQSYGAQYCLRSFLQPNIPLEIRSRIVDALINAFTDQDVNIRKNSANALGHFGYYGVSQELYPKIADALIKVAVEDKDPIVRTCASYSLGNLAWSRITGTVTGLNSRIIDTLILNVSNENSRISRAAVTALREYGWSDRTGISPDERSKIVSSIIIACGHKDPDARGNALLALAVLLSSDISMEVKLKMADTIIQASEDADSNVRARAIGCLGAFAECDISPELRAKIIAILIKASKETQTLVLRNSVEGLSDFGRSNIPSALKNKIIYVLIDTWKSLINRPMDESWDVIHDDMLVTKTAFTLTDLALSKVSPDSTLTIADVFIKTLRAKDANEKAREYAKYALEMMAKSKIPPEIRTKIRNALR